MTEQAIDRGLSDQSRQGGGVLTADRPDSTLVAPAEASIGDFLFLPPGTKGELRVEVSGPGGRPFFRTLEEIELEEGLEVVVRSFSPESVQPGSTKRSETVTVALSSPERMRAVDHLNNNGGYDLSVMDANHVPLRRADENLAQGFFNTKERRDLQKRHRIDREKVRKVIIITRSPGYQNERR